MYRKRDHYTFQLGTFTAMVALTGYLIPLMTNSTRLFKNLTEHFVHVQKLRDLFTDNPVMKGYDTGSSFQYKAGHININHIHFSYEQSDNQKDKIFSDFSLDIAGGRKTALVGASGSGKSTLVKLITGYITPDQGEIIVDNQSLQDISLASYYKHIGYLTQEPSVFDGTIKENLLYGNDTLHSSEVLQKSLDMANCDFINDLSDGLDTEIGERGIRLSGGQRQRLAIAKIFIKNPEIIVLDEPTSALDSFSEEAITEAMHNLFENRTVIIIAHRLQTVKHADDIIVLDQGNIIERGTHNELVQKKGAYAKMLELQSGF